MGRYYSGDIEGKFWFGVQSSTAADRFGSEHFEPNYVSYYFDERHLPHIRNELKYIEDVIGKKNMKLLDKFFNDTNGYNDEIMEEYKKGLSKIWNDHKANYADYRLGKKIKDCIEKNGECSFEAEL